MGGLIGGRVVRGPIFARKCFKGTNEVEADTGKLGMSSGYRKPARRRAAVFRRQHLFITDRNETLKQPKEDLTELAPNAVVSASDTQGSSCGLVVELAC